MTKIFGLRLQKLYKNGQLKNVLAAFSKHIKRSKFIGAGDDASAFKFSNFSVLKLCTKEIKYFEKTPNSSPKNLLKISHSFGKYFLPISKILYEDDYVFVYEQPLREKLNKKTINQNDICQIVEVIIKMINNGFYTNLSTHNLAVYNNKLVVFDYHDIRPFESIEQIKYGIPRWCKELMERLMNFYCCVYAPKSKIKYKSLLIGNNFGETSIKIYKLEQLLPLQFIDLLNYIYMNLNQIKAESLLPYLEEMLTALKANIEY